MNAAGKKNGEQSTHRVGGLRRLDPHGSSLAGTAREPTMTAVQLRDALGSSIELVEGCPARVVEGRSGPIALFGQGSVVATFLEVGHATTLRIFRTLRAGERDGSTLPGVQPQVRLLLEVRTRGRADRVRQLFDYLKKEGRGASVLNDGFYFRLDVVLRGRLPQHKVLRSLLRHA
jgi:hypothetical protein